MSAIGGSAYGGKIKKFHGLTLIETILYLGIAVIILGVLFSYGWNIIGINIKSQVVRETEQSAQLIGERLAYEIRRADSAEIFENPVKLVLHIGADMIVIEDSGNQITIKRGVADPVPLNSQNVQIKHFVLTEQVSDTNETQYVGFSFEAAANYSESSSRSEYQYSSNFSSGAALRTSH